MGFALAQTQSGAYPSHALRTQWAKWISTAGPAVVAAFFGSLVGFLVTGENRLLPSPWHFDDFSNLGVAGSSPRLLTVRPVSFATWSILGRLGPEGLYLGLFACMVLFLAASVLWVGDVLGVARRRYPVAAVAFSTAALFFLFEWSPWTLRYTGHMTNAISAAFGTFAALLALRVHRLSPGGLATLLLAYVLSAFAKEDFLLLPVVSVGLVAFDFRQRSDRAGFARALSVLTVLGAIGIAAVAYNMFANSPFLFGIGTYEASLDPVRLIESALWYATCTPFVQWLGALTIVAMGVSIALGLGKAKRWLVLWLGVAALVGPYLPLTEHRYPLYAANWTPILVAGLGWTVAGLVQRTRSPLVASCAVVVALLLTAGLHRIAEADRRRIAAEISEAQAWTRRAIERVAPLAAGRKPGTLVAVAGSDRFPYGPWFASNGVYLNRRLESEIRWVVLLRDDSLQRRVLQENGWPLDWGRIVNVEAGCRSTLEAAGVAVVDVGPVDRPPEPTGSLSLSDCGALSVADDR